MGEKINQRSERRHECFVPVEGKIGSEFDRVQTVDISRHGIGFLSPQAVGINQKIALEIVLAPHTEPVIVVGVVKWIRHVTEKDQYRVGLVFSEVVSGPSSRLDKYFSSRRFAE